MPPPDSLEIGAGLQQEVHAEKPMKTRHMVGMFSGGQPTWPKKLSYTATDCLDTAS